jgi:hypothetical protein
VADASALSARLDRIAAFVRPADDSLLTFVSILGRSGPSVGLGLLVDGVLVTGAIGPERLFDEALWDATQDALDALHLDDEARDAFEGAWRKVNDLRSEADAEDEELMQRYEASARVDDVEPEDVYALSRLRIADPTVELHGVQLHAVPGGVPVSLDVMRVRVSSISAWWPLKAQGVKVTYASAPAE